MLKKLIILLVIVAPVCVLAQDKLAYIVTNEVFMQMPELKDVETKLSTKQEEIKKNVTAMETEYENMMKRFQSSTDSLSQSLLEDRRKQETQLRERYETYIQNSSKELDELKQQLLAPVQQKFQKAIEDVGAEQGFTYIIDRAALLYINNNAVNAGPLVRAKLGIK
jgi:outer membrane protein